MIKAPLAYRVVLHWLNLPSVKQALAINGIDFSPAFTEALRSKLAAKLQAFYSGHPRQLHPQPRRYLIQFFYELVTLFLNHPDVVSRFLIHRFLPRSYSNSPADILIFSNGLHLASYASLIPILHRHHSVRVVTDRQSPLDAFYLSQYHLFPQPLTPTVSPKDHIWLKLNRKVRHLPVSLPPQLHLPSWITAPKLKALFGECLDAIRVDFLPTFLAKYYRASQVVAHTQPKLLITTHDPGPSAIAFVLAAKKQGIATLVLLHGVPSQGMFFFSDYLLMWGPLIRKFIASQGIPEAKLIPGGQPIFPTYQRYFRKNRPKLKTPTIGIILSGYGANQSHQVKYVTSLLKKLVLLKSPPKIILRLHPGQYLDNIGPAQLDLGSTIEEFIANCSIIISQTSTAVLIAALSNRPLIYFPALHPLVPQGVLWHYRAFGAVNSSAAAAKKVHRLLTEPKYQDQYLGRQRRQVQKYTGPLNKTLSQDLARVITRRFFHD